MSSTRSPAGCVFPDAMGELRYMRKHVEHFHHHFEKRGRGGAAAVPARAVRAPDHRRALGDAAPDREPPAPLLTRPGHRALGDRRADAPRRRSWSGPSRRNSSSNTVTPQEVWKTIQDLRPKRGALGPEEVFAALWGRRVQALLMEPGVNRAGFSLFRLRPAAARRRAVRRVWRQDGRPSRRL